MLLTGTKPLACGELFTSANNDNYKDDNKNHLHASGVLVKENKNHSRHPHLSYSRLQRPGVFCRVRLFWNFPAVSRTQIQWHEQSRKHAASWTAMTWSVSPRVSGWGLHLRISTTLKPPPHTHSRLHGAIDDMAKLTLSPNRALDSIAAVPGPWTATGPFVFSFRSSGVLSAEGFLSLILS